jgi:hypothetical protein
LKLVPNEDHFLSDRGASASWKDRRRSRKPACLPEFRPRPCCLWKTCRSSVPISCAQTPQTQGGLCHRWLCHRWLCRRWLRRRWLCHRWLCHRCCALLCRIPAHHIGAVPFSCVKMLLIFSWSIHHS